MDSAWAAVGVLALALIDGVLPVVPAWTAAVAVGVLAASGDHWAYGLLALAAVGAFVGDSTAYWLGRRYGPRTADRLLRGARSRRLRTWAEGALRTRGFALVACCRLLPGGPTPITMAAGAAGYPWRRFRLAAALAALAWAGYALAVGALGATAVGGGLLPGLLVALGIGLVLNGLLAVRFRTFGPGPSPRRHRSVGRGGGVFQAGLLVLVATGLLAGLAARLAGSPGLADAIWAATTCLGLVPAVGWVVASLRRRQLGADLVAVLALAGALAIGEPLAGAVLAVMVASGRALEAWADRRARQDLSALLDRAPREATRYRGDTLERCPVEAVVRGDRLLVRTGDVVAVDGLVESAVAVLDESALTGEPMPVERTAGDQVRSGVVNTGRPFDLRATTTAEDSAYAGIVRLVRDAQADSAPFVRLANRYAALFLPVTLAAAGLAWAFAGGTRAVAVLVVATPCPLLIAAPVAIVAGLARSARVGVVVKGGGALEQLSGTRTLVLDKTGTLTRGRPVLLDVLTAPGWSTDTVLGFAASVDQASPHVLAAAVVRSARDVGAPVRTPTGVHEVAGQGIRGVVDHQPVAVGKAGFVTGTLPAWARAARRRAAREDCITVFVGVEHQLVGVLLFDDPIRPDAAGTMRRLRRAGLARIVLLTGDRDRVAQSVGAAIGVDQVLAERSPAEKAAAVRAEVERAPTVMVGDGINDAPALAAATVGVALGARGASASSEAADVVLTVDRIDRLGDAIQTARRSHRIARESAAGGMALSFAGMALALVGLMTPVAGALVQEAIDVAVILNALRALRPGRDRPLRLEGPDAEMARVFSAEHVPLRPGVDELRRVADAADDMAPAELLRRTRELAEFLSGTLYPHELAEEHELYPVLDKALGGHDPTGLMSRAHAEIGHEINRLTRLLADIGSDEPDEVDVREIRQLLYGLHAILRLHFAQEEEGYFTLVDEPAPPPSVVPPP